MSIGLNQECHIHLTLWGGWKVWGWFAGWTGPMQWIQLRRLVQCGHLMQCMPWTSLAHCMQHVPTLVQGSHTELALGACCMRWSFQTSPRCWLCYMGLVCGRDQDWPQSQCAGLVQQGTACSACPGLTPYAMFSAYSTRCSPTHCVWCVGWHMMYAACGVSPRPTGWIIELHRPDLAPNLNSNLVMMLL